MGRDWLLTRMTEQQMSRVMQIYLVDHAIGPKGTGLR